jgi:hypothetical protein
MDLGIYSGSAQVNEHTLLQTMGTSAPLTLKMMRIKNKLFRRIVKSFGSKDMAAYMNIIVQRVLSVQVQQPEKLQRHNLFQIFFVINNR